MANLIESTLLEFHRKQGIKWTGISESDAELIRLVRELADRSPSCGYLHRMIYLAKLELADRGQL